MMDTEVHPAVSTAGNGHEGTPGGAVTVGLTATTYPPGPHVYFVQAAAGGPIKIGVATNLANRLKGLQYMCPVRLVCLAFMPGYTDEEAELHERFGATRLHGEWFEPTDELLALIALLQCDPIAVPQMNLGQAYRQGQRELRTLAAELRKLRRDIREAQHDLERVCEARRRTQWRVVGCDPDSIVEDMREGFMDEIEAIERLVETECEMRVTVFWDDAHDTVGIREVNADPEFTDAAWETIVEAVAPFADSLSNDLRGVTVLW